MNDSHTSANLWRYAGLHIDEVQHNDNHAERDITQANVNNTARFTITMDDNNEYVISRGYYIPYYKPPTEENILSMRYKALVDMASRFDHNAHTDRKHALSYEQITKLERLYSEETVARKKKVHGAELVHAKIGFLERAAQALQQDAFNRAELNTDVSRIALTDNITDKLIGYNTKTVEDQRATRAEIKKMITATFNDLMFNTELVAHLRKPRPIRYLKESIQQHGSAHLSDKGLQGFAQLSDRFDYTGALHEMVQEVGKEASIGSGKNDATLKVLIDAFLHTQKGRQIKIGTAMRCIDSVCERLKAICRAEHTFDSLHTEDSFDKLAKYAKRIICIRGSDIPAAQKANAQYRAILDSLNHDNKTLKGSSEQVDKTLKLLEFGFDLIADMVDTRLPCNEVFWNKETDGKINIPHYPGDKDCLPDYQKHRENINKGFLYTPNSVDARSPLGFFEDAVHAHLREKQKKQTPTLITSAGRQQHEGFIAGTSAGLTM